MATAPITRRLEYLPLEHVLRAPRNPNAHDLPGLRASIRRHGFVEPVIVDERTGYLVGGHGRLDALVDMRAEGEAPPEGVTLSEPGGTWYLPVVLGWHSRSDAEAEALLVSMLKLPKTPVAADQAPTLLAMLDELAQGTELGLEGTGYTADDLDDLLASLGAGVLPSEGTDASHAPLPPRADPAAPREVQGLREVGLMFSSDQHRQYVEHLAKLKRAWEQDAAPAVVLRALELAASGC